MQSKFRIGLLIFLFALAGVLLFVYLLSRHGISDIADAIAHAGWGLAWVIAFHVITLFLDSLSWRL